MAVVVFDPDEWREFYPDLGARLTDEQLRHLFELACLILDNTDSSPVPYDPEKGILVRKTLLYLLVCHLATMSQWKTGQSGPMTSATQGSVSVGFAVNQATDDSFLDQTPCGQAFLRAMRPYAVGGRYYAANHWHPWG